MIRITTIIITTFCWAVTAQAVTLFPAGAESKIMGIESSLESEGPLPYYTTLLILRLLTTRTTPNPMPNLECLVLTISMNTLNMTLSASRLFLLSRLWDTQIDSIIALRSQQFFSREKVEMKSKYQRFPEKSGTHMFHSMLKIKKR